jgi:hypothetical protein
MTTVITTYFGDTILLGTHENDRIATEIRGNRVVPSGSVDIGGGVYQYDIPNPGNYTITINVLDTSPAGTPTTTFTLEREYKNGTIETLDEGSISPDESLQLATGTLLLDETEIIRLSFVRSSGILVDFFLIVWEERDNFFINSLTELNTTNVVFEPQVIAGTATINTNFFINNSFVFRKADLREELLKLIRIVKGDSQSNTPTDLSISPRLVYYSINPDKPNLTSSDLLFSPVTNLLDPYIPSEKSIINNTQYKSFYIKNETSSNIRNISFWVNGGDKVYYKTNAFNGTINESDFFTDRIDDLKTNLTEFDIAVFKNKANVQTSLFDQIKIEFSVAEKNTILRKDDANFEDIEFFPAQNKQKLPNLSPGEFVGIYLKITSLFNVNYNVPLDFSFLHFEYLKVNRKEINRIPGQVYSTEFNTYLSRALPSIPIIFVTNYERLLKLIEETTEDLYSNYPPFFLYYQDGEVEED